MPRPGIIIRGIAAPIDFLLVVVSVPIGVRHLRVGVSPSLQNVGVKRHITKISPCYGTGGLWPRADNDATE